MRIVQQTVTLTEPGTASAAARTIPTVLMYPQAADSRRGPTTYPLVVFSPGYDIAPEAYGPLLDRWARAGYVVAEPEFPHTAPGAAGGVYESDILSHPGDLRFVISSLTSGAVALLGLRPDRIDAQDVAIAGHSDGGDVALAVAAAPCCRYPGLKAALILSGAELSSLSDSYYASGSVPILVTQGSADVINPPPCSTQLYDSAPPPRYYLSLVGAAHLPPYETAANPEDPVGLVTTAFLDKYLKGDATAMSAVGRAMGPDAVLTSGGPVPPAPGTCPGAPGN